MIGNLLDAQTIYRRRRNGNGPLPKGWKKIGEGSFRQAYLSPDGVVYKVCKEYYSNSSQDAKTNDNDLEFLQYSRIKKQRIKYKGWKINPVESFYFKDGFLDVTINVSPFVKGRHEVFADLDPDLDEMPFDRAFSHFGLDDAHDENYVLADGGRRWIIDLSSQEFTVNKENLVIDIMDFTGDDELFEGSIQTAVDMTTQAFIKALRKEAGRYEDMKFITVASAFKQFANELEQS